MIPDVEKTALVDQPEARKNESVTDTEKSFSLTLKVWRQKNAGDKGKFVTYQAKRISPDMSFLEMLDQVNEELTAKGEDPIAFDHDCREGICGSCSLAVNGVAHGPEMA